MSDLLRLILQVAGLNFFELIFKYFLRIFNKYINIFLFMI